MKYFTSELWDNAATTESAHQMLEKNKNLYSDYFDTIKHKFSKRFLSIHTSEEGFHDCFINELSFLTDSQGHVTAKFLLDTGSKIITLTLKRVSYYHVSVPTLENSICGRLGWGYDEFFLHEDGRLQLNILCDINCEIEICFRHLLIDSSQK